MSQFLPKRLQNAASDSFWQITSPQRLGTLAPHVFGATHDPQSIFSRAAPQLSFPERSPQSLPLRLQNCLLSSAVQLHVLPPSVQIFGVAHTPQLGITRLDPQRSFAVIPPQSALAATQSSASLSARHVTGPASPPLPASTVDVSPPPPVSAVAPPSVVPTVASTPPASAEASSTAKSPRMLEQPASGPIARAPTARTESETSRGARKKPMKGSRAQRAANCQSGRVSPHGFPRKAAPQRVGVAHSYVSSRGGTQQLVPTPQMSAHRAQLSFVPRYTHPSVLQALLRKSPSQLQTAPAPHDHAPPLPHVFPHTPQLLGSFVRSAHPVVQQVAPPVHAAAPLHTQVPALPHVVAVLALHVPQSATLRAAPQLSVPLSGPHV